MMSSDQPQTQSQNQLQTRASCDNTDSLIVEVYHSIAELSEEVLQRWRALCDASLDCNVFLTPEFVIPALNHLPAGQDIVIIVVDKALADGRQTVALGIFEAVMLSRFMPCRMLRSYRSQHSFLSGLLLHREHAHAGAYAMFEHIKYTGKWHGVELIDCPTETAIGAAISHAANACNARWRKLVHTDRRMLYINNSGEDYLKRTLSKRTLKSLNRKKRRLQDMGELQWRCVTGDAINQQTIDNFLVLENQGWKQKNNSALEADAKQKTFFVDMIKRFAAREQVFFTEVRLNDKVIASTVNLIAGRTGFAFKLGWDVSYHKYSIGLLNEVELIRHAPELALQLSSIDSGAMPGSFIEKIWKDERPLLSGVYALHSAVLLYLNVRHCLCFLKGCLKPSLRSTAKQSGEMGKLS